MFKLTSLAEALLPIAAAVILGILMLIGVFQLTLGSLLICALVFVIGAYVGLMLGRRSKTANLYADRIKAEIDEIEARTKQFRRDTGLD